MTDNSNSAAFEMKSQEKISNERIRAKINQRLSKDRPDIIKRVKTRQAIWFGHATRMEETRLPKIAMNEEIQLKNKQGRPRQRLGNLTKEDSKYWH